MTKRESIVNALEAAETKYKALTKVIRDINWDLEWKDLDEETASLLKEEVANCTESRKVIIEHIDKLYTELAKLNAEEN